MQDVEAIRELLRRVRARWRLVRLLEATMRAALAASLVVGVALVSSHFVRTPVAFALAGVGAALLIVAVMAWALAPARERPSDRRIARLIEERAPLLDDRLASAVDLIGLSAAQTGFADAMLADTARRVSAIALDDVVPLDRVRRWGLAAAAAVVLLAGLLFAARGLGRQTVDTLALIFFPSRLTIEVTPGDARVLAGAPLVIRARLVGNTAPVAARLRIAEGDRRRLVDMAEEGKDGSREFHLDLSPATSGFVYEVTAGSVVSRPYSVTVVRPPRVTRIDIDYTYPAALGLPPRTDEDSGDIYAPAGTSVRVRIHVDRPVASGWMALATRQTIALTEASPTEFSAAFKLAADNSYRVSMTDRDGVVNPGDAEYFIRLLDDRPPQVHLVRPAADRGVSALEEVDVEAQADDDFGVARLELVYAVDGRTETVVRLPIQNGATCVAGRHTLFLEDLGVHPGDFISYYVRAFDVARGKPPNEARSDIFFLEVRPFEQEFAVSQGRSGSKTPGIDDLVTAQKEVVVSTWKLERRSEKTTGVRDQDVRAVARAEAELKSRVEETASAFRESTMRNPRQRQRPGAAGSGPGSSPATGPSAGAAPRAGQTLTEEDAMTAASAAMGRAVASLTALKTRDAVAPEMDALTNLLKAQAAVKRREVAPQAQAGNGAGDTNRNYDLSSLFDKELQRSQQTNYENRSSAEQPPEDKSALSRIKELARRQDELIKRQQELARNGGALGNDAAKRELEKLTREQTELRQRAEELAAQFSGTQARTGAGERGRQMREASEEMRGAASDLRRQDAGTASARASRALDKLRQAERQLGSQSSPARGDERRRALGDMQLEARQLAAAQRHIADATGSIGAREEGRDTARRLAGEQEGLADRLRMLQDGLKRASGNVAHDVERQDLIERMQKAAAALRATAGREGSGATLRPNAEEQRAIARALDKTADSLESAKDAGDGDARRLSEQLSRSRDVRERLDSLGDKRTATTGTDKADAAKLRDEYARQLQNARKLLDELGRRSPDSPGSGAGATPIGSGMVMSAPGTESFKQDFAQWEQLRRQMTRALEDAEAVISKKLIVAYTRDRLPAGVDDEAPSEYQKQVDSYFKAIAGKKKVSFAYPFPWWAALAVAVAAGALAFIEYRRPLSPLTASQRGVLVALRVAALSLVTLFMFRPIVLILPSGARDVVVPILVDVSRSMRLTDADSRTGDRAGGRSRLDRATALLETELLPALSPQYTTELYSIGDSLTPAILGQWSATARHSDLAGAIAAVRQRYRGRRVAGIVLLSDGGDTSGSGASEDPPEGSPPIFTVGIGGSLRDREIVALTAGEQRLDQASVDLHVVAMSAGFGRAPFELRLLSGKQVIETRRIVPQGDGSPIEATFTVSPDPLAPNVYTAEIPPDEREAVTENNARSVLVSPSGRKRRLLVVEGAPGFEHSFMERAWMLDSGLEVDSIVRKGRNSEGQDTFLVQAAGGRSAALTSGFPLRREDLFGYDALVLANVDGDALTRAQIAATVDFVGDRGGGLLVLGGRSFAPRGLIGTAIEEVLPVELSDRRGGILRAVLASGEVPRQNKLALTADGERHPIMRIGDSPEDIRRRWAALPALASIAAVGGSRPAATVLAVTAGQSGGVYPVIAVQPYGLGRSMIFAGEASWRWKMMLASTDRTHELFWRQAVRWLATPAPDPVAISIPESVEPGDAAAIAVDVRDAAFAPASDAVVDASLTLPAGEVQPLTLGRADAAHGRFSTIVTPDEAGLYQIHAEARHASDRRTASAPGSALLGTADRWMLVGGADRELADPRLNEDVLRRLARRSGGSYTPAASASRIVPLLRTAVPQTAAPESRDLWHEPWALALVVGLLSAEWILRRRWGLR